MSRLSPQVSVLFVLRAQQRLLHFLSFDTEADLKGGADWLEGGRG